MSSLLGYLLLMLTMHSSKMYMLPSFLLWSIVFIKQKEFYNSVISLKILLCSILLRLLRWKCLKDYCSLPSYFVLFPSSYRMSSMNECFSVFSPFVVLSSDDSWGSLSSNS